MSKNKTIIALGLWIAIVPFLGFPGAWKTFFITTSGLAIVFISFMIIAKKRAERPQESENNTYHKDSMEV